MKSTHNSTAAAAAAASKQANAAGSNEIDLRDGEFHQR
jgi:hypothetical protein